MRAGGRTPLIVSLRVGLYIQHIQSADLFACHAAAIEDEIPLSTGLMAYQAYVIGSVFAAVASLEAVINHVFADSADPNFASNAFKNSMVEHLSADIRTLLATVWQFTGIDRKPNAIDKFSIALKLASISGPPMGGIDMGGGSAYDDAKCLINLRNYLTHYIPSTTTFPSNGEILIQDKAGEVLEEKLRNKKIPLNKVDEMQNGPFPTRYLSAGCARWAVASSARFTLDFFSAIGITSSFETVLLGLAQGR